MPMVDDYLKRIIDSADELKQLEVEIKENEVCPKLKQQRAKILQNILDGARPALEWTSRELRRYRTPCEDCARCSENVDNL